MLVAELNRNRRIGVEHELAILQIGSGNGADVRRVVANILSANGCPAVARGYSHIPVPHGQDFAVEYDSTVHGEGRFCGMTWQAVELKTRILNGIDDWEAIVPDALAICRYIGGRVNVSTGTHVHVDLPEVRLSPVVIRNLFNVVHRYEHLIYGLVAPSRLRNSYTLPLPDRPGHLARCRTLDCFRRSLSRISRQSGINFTHLWGDEPRIEFRYHHGTLDAEKSRHWVRFLLRLTDHACTRRCKSSRAKLENNRANLDKMLTTLGFRVNSRVYAKVDPELRETGRYLLKRWKSLNESD